MPDYAPEIHRKAADAVFAQNIHGSSLAGMNTRQEAEAIASAVLDAVAEELGEAVAGKILASMEASGPSMRVKPGSGGRRDGDAR